MTTFGYIHSNSSRSKSCCNRSQPGACTLLLAWTFLTTQRTGPLLYRSVGLLHQNNQKKFCGWEIDQKKQKHRGWMLVAEECVACPWTAQRASYFIRTNKKIPLNTVQVCTYARWKSFTDVLQTKSDTYSSKLRTAFRRRYKLNGAKW